MTAPPGSTGPTPPRRLAVVGGGIAGLAAAHRWLELERAEPRASDREAAGDAPVVLFEARERFGGPIHTLERDGFLLEEGPDSFLTEKSTVPALAERLGLAARLVSVEPAARRSLVVRHGRLHPLPDGFFLLAPVALRPFLATPLLSWAGKLRAACEPLLPPRRTAADESVSDFVRRRFGPELLEAIAEPLVTGIYGADPADLSAAATLPRFVTLERRAGSVVLGLRERRDAASARGARYGLFASFDRGLGVLVEALTNALPAGCARLATPVRGVRPGPGGGWEVLTAAGPESFDAVLLATPARQSALWLEPLDARLANELGEVRYRSSATLQLAYRAADLPPFEAAGFVVPRREGYLVRGCTWSHRKYAGRAPAGFGLLRVYFGEEAVDLEPAAVEARARQELEQLLGITAPPLFTHWATHRAAVPQYRVGHLERAARVHEGVARHPGLELAGSAFGGVGIPDVIAGAERAAESLRGNAGPGSTPSSSTV